ncbi:ATP-binding protein [Actinomadura scrupuli]|uniref:ATP-binding protein n=1 Tax=Actinomadura scrupuli TaxID=559629 RepID=UPI003D973D8B
MTDQTNGKLILMLMFPGLDAHVPAVRGYLRAVFRDHSRLDDLLLLLTELLTNALRHTRSGGKDGMVTLAVLDTGAAARLEVIDQGGKTRPELRTDPPEESESGYGLGLVTGLASGWGAVPWGEGTKTWFEI